MFISLKRWTISKFSFLSKYNEGTNPFVNILLINSKIPKYEKYKQMFHINIIC